MSRHDLTLARRAKALGWFSIALGLMELAAPERLARALRIKPSRRTKTLLRAYGTREVVAGLGILSQPLKPTWIWSRLVGDAIDLASLATAALAREATDDRLGQTLAGVTAITLLDAVTGWQLTQADAASAAASRR